MHGRIMTLLLWFWFCVFVLPDGIAGGGAGTNALVVGLSCHVAVACVLR